MDKTRVLQVEDDADDAAILSTVMARSKGSYELERVGTLEEGVKRAATGEFDVIFTDLGLPDSTGLNSVKCLRAACPGAVIIVHSGNESEYLNFEALEHGADDCLCKRDLTSVTLHRCIQQNRIRMGQRSEIQRLLKMVSLQSSVAEEQTVQLAQENERLKMLCEAS